MNPWLFWMRQGSAAFVCFIVGWGVATALELVRDRISKKNIADKKVFSDGGANERSWKKR